MATMILMGLFVFAGSLISLAGTIMFLVAAFRQSVWWGLAVLFVPLANLVFLIKYWAEAKMAFLIQIGGTLLCVVSGMVLLRVAVDKLPRSLAHQLNVRPSLSVPASRPRNPVASQTNMGGPATALVRPEAVVQPTEKKPAQTRSATDQRQYVGMTLENIETLLGKPKAVLTIGGQTTYFYPGLELVSDNGTTVTSQAEMY